MAAAPVSRDAWAPPSPSRPAHAAPTSHQRPIVLTRASLAATHTHTLTHTHRETHARTGKGTSTYTHTHTHACIYTRTYTCTYTRTYTHIHALMYTHTRAFTHIHAQTHAYMHIHTRTLGGGGVEVGERDADAPCACACATATATADEEAAHPLGQGDHPAIALVQPASHTLVATYRQHRVKHIPRAYTKPAFPVQRTTIQPARTAAYTRPRVHCACPYVCLCHVCAYVIWKVASVCVCLWWWWGGGGGPGRRAAGRVGRGLHRCNGCLERHWLLGT
jgi:hypothetical protein